MFEGSTRESRDTHWVHHCPADRQGMINFTASDLDGMLAQLRIPATVRLTRGRDIEAACGQLASARVPSSA